MIHKAPDAVYDLINQYLNLKLDGKVIRCPYYINLRKERMGLRVLIGKGTPEEIIQESLIYEKLRGVDFSIMSEDEIREFLVKRHIGIECAGFVVHVLNAWLKTRNKKYIWNYLNFPKQNIYRIIARKLRPVENISAKLLTSDENTNEIRNLHNIMPGDLIRCTGIESGFHVVIIIETEKEEGKLISFKYAHSSRWYEKDHGVRIGKVKIINEKGKLWEQEWLDKHGERNWILEELQKDKNYTSVRRLKKINIS